MEKISLHIFLSKIEQPISGLLFMEKATFFRLGFLWFCEGNIEFFTVTIVGERKGIFRFGKKNFTSLNEEFDQASKIGEISIERKYILKMIEVLFTLHDLSLDTALNVLKVGKNGFLEVLYNSLKDVGEHKLIHLIKRQYITCEYKE